MIAPTYYRSQLTAEEQEMYKEIVNGLLLHNNTICLRKRDADQDAIVKTVAAIHRDHPELFYVDFWRFQTCRNLHSFGTKVEFNLLLGRSDANAVANTLSQRARDLQAELNPNMTRNQLYCQVARHISSTTTYVDTGSAFWDHTVAGPILRHTAVCEGVSKLFLFLCQRAQLPCAMVTGTSHGEPHAWNMVEIGNMRRYVDVTSFLSRSHLVSSSTLFLTGELLHQHGYEWQLDLSAKDRLAGQNR